jgi:hypothetical protein
LAYWRRAGACEDCAGHQGVFVLRRIRVLLADMPPLLDEIVRTILGTEPDVELDPTSVASNEMATAEVVATTDVLIVAEQQPAKDDYAPTLYAHPRLRLVAISDDRKRAMLYELRPHRTSLGELSSHSLVRAVRGESSAPGGRP